MLVTYKIHSATALHNTSNILDALFGDLPQQELRTTPNKVYQDFSYDRYKTVDVQREQFMLRSTKVNSEEQTLEQLNNITAMIQIFLMTHGSPSEMYHTFKIPKRSGGMRTINAPNPELMEFMRTLQPWFSYKLNALPHDSAYAYVHNRDCHKALKRHQSIKSNWFLKLDLKDFFNNCDSAFIRKQLRNLYPFALMKDEAYDYFITYLTSLVTKDDGLPQGTPLSPVLTNLIMVAIDHDINKDLNAYFKDKDQTFMYTRYADDMLISSNKEMTASIIVKLINQVLVKYNDKLKVNPSKTRYGSKAGSNWNLGIMYNKENNLTVGYKRKKKIKTMLFQFIMCYNNGTRDKEYAQAILGELAYLHNIEPDYTTQLVSFINNKYNTDSYNILRKTLKEN